ncbi:MAG: 1-acyl-sn-glycerol-3-phosphate acyltransferase, partial [Gammaproteobacteria bacterium]|nr:1-acyl-sn-glycerol-3-phosphate acyltransferase [Gammaproteobacteria bacterium]
MPLPHRARLKFIAQWSVFNLWWLRITCRLKHKVLGLENIPKDAAIIMCKHQSAWETLALQLHFPPQVWVLKRELLW